MAAQHGALRQSSVESNIIDVASKSDNDLSDTWRDLIGDGTVFSQWVSPWKVQIDSSAVKDATDNALEDPVLCVNKRIVSDSCGLRRPLRGATVTC